MSLANENDLIIPGTVGTISAAVKEANRHLDRYREHAMQDENRNKNRNKNIAEYIKEMLIIHYILQNRINGVALDQLVTPTRISNDSTRSVKVKEEQEEEKPRVYESWFRE